MRNNEWLFFKNVTAIKKHLNILQTIRGLNKMSGHFSDCVYFRQLFRMLLCNTNKYKFLRFVHKRLHVQEGTLAA